MNDFGLVESEQIWESGNWISVPLPFVSIDMLLKVSSWTYLMPVFSSYKVEM